MTYIEGINFRELRRQGDAEAVAQAAFSVGEALAAIGRVPTPAQLVHGDFNRRNIQVHCVGGPWKVAAVLDWEFATRGSPLTDIGTFLRYDVPTRLPAEPHFSNGFIHGGGILPEDWRYLSKRIDLDAICEALTHPLPEDAERELREILQATLENPRFCALRTGPIGRLLDT